MTYKGLLVSYSKLYLVWCRVFSNSFCYIHNCVLLFRLTGISRIAGCCFANSNELSGIAM